MDAFTALRKNRTLDAQSAFNAAFYRSSTRSNPQEGLTAQETVTLLKYQEHLVDRDVLDIGVGTGRTARVLAGLARCYAAIDTSPLVVAKVREVMPEVDVHIEDMRDLGRWDDGTMDFIFAANGVLDAVSHADREKTLGETRRVLRAGGLLVFSSHNRCYSRAQAVPRPRRSRNPVTFAMQVLRYLASLRQQQRMKPLRHFEFDYALIDESVPGRALLHYHIDRTAQDRQLTRLGFQLIDVIDHAGETVPPGEMAPRSRSLMYVARKAG